MTRRAGLAFLLLAGALLAAAARAAPAGGEAFDIAVVGHTFPDELGDADLKRTIARADREKPAFVIAVGIKSADEPCSDRLYLQRKGLLNKSDQPLVLVLTGDDWTGCRNSAGRSNAIERLNRIREIYYDGQEALGRRKLDLNRQSTITKFRSYAENAYWEMHGVLFATINLPARNNHYLLEAGRNSEYEDRLVANRFWLNRLFAIARRDQLEAVVLFSEGDLKALSQPTGLRALLRRAVPDNDGFAETRRHVMALAQKFRGKVLLVDTAGLAKGVKPAIEWRGNVGHLSAGAGALEVAVDPANKTLFKLEP